jgi:hypothetical protein
MFEKSSVMSRTQRAVKMPVNGPLEREFEGTNIV